MLKVKNISIMLYFFSFTLGMVQSVVYAQEISINGTGSSFAYPLFANWGKIYVTLTGVDLKYHESNSVSGINSVVAREVDFAASELPLSDAELKENSLIQFPISVGGIVPIVNLPNIEPGQLRLNGFILAEIYNGKIQKWNDASIVALNKDLHLPDILIKPVYRSDPSGTTYLFSEYLSKMDDDWKRKFGLDTRIHWPVGNGVVGNENLALYVKHTEGAIGYVEFVYARSLNYVSLQNSNGQYLVPSREGFAKALESANWNLNNDFRLNLINEPGEKSWPIVGLTYVILPLNPKDRSRSLAVIDFFDWAYTAGFEIAERFDFIPIPEKIYGLIEKKLMAQIKDSSRSEISSPIKKGM